MITSVNATIVLSFEISESVYLWAYNPSLDKLKYMDRFTPDQRQSVLGLKLKVAYLKWLRRQ